MRSIIFAGVINARLPLFKVLIPKQIFPIGNKYSILEILKRQLAKNNFSRSAIAINPLCHLIETYFRGRKRYDFKINYSSETKSIGTTLLDH